MVQYNVLCTVLNSQSIHHSSVIVDNSDPEWGEKCTRAFPHDITLGAYDLDDPRFENVPEDWTGNEHLKFTVYDAGSAKPSPRRSISRRKSMKKGRSGKVNTLTTLPHNINTCLTGNKTLAERD